MPFLRLTATALVLLTWFSCTPTEEEKKTEQVIEQKVLSDQEKLDSAEAAINRQLESVSDDSILKSVQ